ncbi:MAG: alpha/beta hydrolase [Chthoniobacteraceae bacterium]
MKSLPGFAALLGLLCLLAQPSPSRADTAAAQIQTIADIAYKNGGALSEYEIQRCKLDIYLPPGGKKFATLVWFHGGALKAGSKGGSSDKDKTPAIAHALAGEGIAVVAVNYRLSPKVKFPAYLEDAAASVAWVRAHIAEHGGDPAKVFISGHSAGGWIALMLAMDARWLKPHGLTPDSFAGYVPLSGQTMTHYTVREERGIGKETIIADEAAPVYYCRKDTPPMLVLAADHDMAARSEENEYFVAALKGTGNKRVTFRQIPDRTHGSIAHNIVNTGDPVRRAILDFIAATDPVSGR